MVKNCWNIKISCERNIDNMTLYKEIKEELTYNKSEEWVWPWWCYNEVIVGIWKMECIWCGIVILIELMN